MSGVSVSRRVRVEVEARFGALFNDALVAAAVAFGSEQRIAINFDGLEGLPKNYANEDRTLQAWASREEPDLPALAMWAGPGINDSAEKSRVFSGRVMFYWRVFLFVRGMRKTGLVEQREIFEAALIDMLDPEFSGIGFNGDLAWSEVQEKEVYGPDDRLYGWAQDILFTGSFLVNV